jgi:hypothetical protein
VLEIPADYPSVEAPMPSEDERVVEKATAEGKKEKKSTTEASATTTTTLSKSMPKPKLASIVVNPGEAATAVPPVWNPNWEVLKKLRKPEWKASPYSQFNATMNVEDDCPYTGLLVYSTAARDCSTHHTTVLADSTLLPGLYIVLEEWGNNLCYCSVTYHRKHLYRAITTKEFNCFNPLEAPVIAELIDRRVTPESAVYYMGLTLALPVGRYYLVPTPVDEMKPVIKIAIRECRIFGRRQETLLREEKKSK